MDTTQVTAPRRARMAHYAMWQARDYVFERGLPTMLIAALFGFIGGRPLRAMRHQVETSQPSPEFISQHGSLEAARQAVLVDNSLVFLRSFLGAIVFLGALFAMNGLVSNDRKNGFYRFLFAKPVTAERYYGQAFVLHGIGFLVACVLLALLWGVLIVPVISVNMMAAMWLVYLCYAGVAFLLTAAAKWDWLSLVAVAFASNVLWSEFGASAHPLAKLLYLLPPLTRVDSVYAAVAKQAPLPWNTLAWLAGYGIACFVAALVVLRHRRLATP